MLNDTPVERFRSSLTLVRAVPTVWIGVAA
jgi:hypothetical protein